MYHGLQGRVYKMLQNLAWTRERSRKDEALTKLLTSNKHWDGPNAVFRLEELIDLNKNFNSADRYWRLLTAEYKELQGTDYDTKAVVEQKKMQELGYESGYRELSTVGLEN